MIDLTFRESSSEGFDDERIERLSSESVSLVATMKLRFGNESARSKPKE